MLTIKQFIDKYNVDMTKQGINYTVDRIGGQYTKVNNVNYINESLEQKLLNRINNQSDNINNVSVESDDNDKLIEYENKIEEYQNQIEQLESELSKYKNIIDGLNKKNNDNDELIEELKLQYESRIEELKNHNQDLKTRLDNKETVINNKDKVIEKLVEKKDIQIEKLNQILINQQVIEHESLDTESNVSRDREDVKVSESDDNVKNDTVKKGFFKKIFGG